MTRSPCLFIAVSLFIFSHVGCSSLKLPGPSNLLMSSTEASAVRCLCLWQPVETEDLSGRPVRGFGGQVYFFSADSEEPVAVDGDVRVFVFDDNGSPDEQARPKDIQNYDPLVWKSFLTESQFGSNYSLFIPYDQAGKQEAVCSLRLRLTRPDGSTLFSEMATVKLAGEPRDDKSIRQLVNPRDNSIRPDRSSELRVNAGPSPDTNGRVSTIGSIREGGLSLSDEYEAAHHTSNHSPTSDSETGRRRINDQTNSQVRIYQEKLAAMHASFEKSKRAQSQSTRPVNHDLSDLMPAIRQVSGRSPQPRQRVALTAHEVFSAEHSGSSERSQSDETGSRTLARKHRNTQQQHLSARSIFGADEVE